MKPEEIEELKRKINEVLHERLEVDESAKVKPLDELVEDLKVYQYELEFQNEELKRIQLDLELSRQEYFQLFEEAPVCYVILDENFTILKKNRLFYHNFGAIVQDKKDIDFRTLVAPSSQNEFYYFYKDLFAKGSAKSTEIQMISAKNKTYWVQLDANKFTLGQISYYRLSLLDISESKELHLMMEASEKEKRTITDNMTDMVVISDPSGTITYVSPSIKQFGFLPAEYLGKTVFDFVHPDDLNYAVNSFNQGIDTRGKNAIVFRTPVKEGGSVWVETSGAVVLDEDGKVEQAVLVVRNIEERLKTERALKYANDLFTQVGNMARIGAWEFDVSDKTLFWSPVTRSIYEVPDEYCPKLDEAYAFFSDAEHRKLIVSAVEKALLEGVGYDMELQVKTFKEKLIWVRVKGIPVYEDGKVVKLRGLFQDINEIKNAEIDLKNYAQKLHENNIAKDKLFSIIAHDLRSPFNAFLNLTELLNEDYNSFTEAEIRNLTKTIYSSALNLNVLINNLLEWSRLHRGSLQPKKSVNLLRDTIKQAAEALQTQINAKSQSLIVAANETFIANYDSDMLATILRNLLSNAVKFSPKGGVIKLNLSTEGQSFSIDIVDSGLGIPLEIQPFLFEINEIKGRKGTEGEKSCGLGLMICKELIEIHNGSISLIESSPKGSRFRITMPLNM